jgi:16S rRNA U1498 N3-methylase RsmE
VSRRVRAPLTGLREGENTTTPELERYLRRVLRRKPGDAVTLFDPVTSREASAVLPETEGTLVCGPVREAEVVALVPELPG